MSARRIVRRLVRSAHRRSAALCFFGLALPAVGLALGGEPRAGRWRLDFPTLRAVESGAQAPGGCILTLRVPESHLAVRCAITLNGPVLVGLRQRGEPGVSWTLGRAAGRVEVASALAPEAARLLLAGSLELVVDAREAGGELYLGGAEDPVFLSDFEVDGLCEWSNFLAACDDANVCTDDLCAGADGSCSHESNTSACELPDATGICSAGACTLSTCDSGHSNCDANDQNGCEVNHNAASNTCGGAVNLGSYAADEACGFICNDNSTWTQFGLQTNRTERWFRARAVEDSDCSTPLSHRIVLTVPPGVDYDLYAYSDCSGTLIGSSTTTGLGLPETIVLEAADNVSIDDSFDYFIEVRWKSGASCVDYTLSFQGHASC